MLHELQTARTLGIADLALARCDVQAKTGSAKSPGQVLHVLAIGIDKFGDRAGGLHLDYADDDARDVVTAPSRKPEERIVQAEVSTPT